MNDIDFCVCVCVCRCCLTRWEGSWWPMMEMPSSERWAHLAVDQRVAGFWSVLVIDNLHLHGNRSRSSILQPSPWSRSAAHRMKRWETGPHQSSSWVSTKTCRIVISNISWHHHASSVDVIILNVCSWRDAVCGGAVSGAADASDHHHQRLQAGSGGHAGDPEGDQVHTPAFTVKGQHEGLLLLTVMTCFLEALLSPPVVFWVCHSAVRVDSWRREAAEFPR